MKCASCPAPATVCPMVGGPPFCALHAAMQIQLLAEGIPWVEGQYLLLMYFCLN